MERKKTLGQIISEVKTSNELSDVTYKDAAAHMGKDLDKALQEGVVKGLAAFKKDFYLEVLFKHHKHLGKVIHYLVDARETCPRPNYSECVYKYYQNDKRFEVLWALPPRNIAFKYMNGQIDDGKITQNLQWVVEFETGVMEERYKKIRDAENIKLEKV